MFTVKFKGCPQVAVSSQILRLRVDSGRGHRVDAPFTPALLRRSNARAAAIGGRARTGKGKWRSRPISRVLSWTVIPLGDASPRRSSSLPGPDAGRVMRSLFGLAPGGVCRAGLLPGSRCALTAPFHPCLIPRHPAAAFPEGTWPMLRIVMSPLCGAAPGWRGPSAVSFCCTFRRLAPPRRYLAPCPVEPGLSSACLRMTRLSGRLRRLPFYGFRRRVSGSHEIRFSYSKPGASTPGGAAAAGATASASGGAAAARPERKHRLRAGAAATRGFRPPRGSASCSNTRARYIHVPLGRNPLAATSFAAMGGLVSLGYGNSTGADTSRVSPLDETSGLNVAKDAVVRGSGASRPWMACARLLEPGTAESGDAHDPRTAAAPPRNQWTPALFNLPASDITHRRRAFFVARR